MKRVFQRMRLRLSELKVLAFCRRVISSKFGWRHRPGEGVATGVCEDAALIDWGVAGFEFLLVTAAVVFCRVVRAVNEAISWSVDGDN